MRQIFSLLVSTLTSMLALPNETLFAQKQLLMKLLVLAEQAWRLCGLVVMTGSPMAVSDEPSTPNVWLF